MPLTFEQFKQLRARGLSPQQIAEFEKRPKQIKEAKEKKSGLQKLTEGITSFIGGKELATGAVKAFGPNSTKAILAQTESANKLVDLAKKLNVDDPRRKKLLEEALNISNTASYTAAKEVSEIPSNKQVLGSAAKLGLTVGGIGMGAAGTAVGRIGQGTALGAGFGAASAAEEDASMAGIGKGALIGGALGGAVSGAIEGVRWAVKGVPKLLSYSSKTPEKVLYRNFDRPEPMARAFRVNQKSTPDEFVSHVQKAGEVLRRRLTEQYDDGVKTLIEQNTGRRIGFTSEEQKLLTRVADDWGIELPKNLKNISTKEAFALNKEFGFLGVGKNAGSSEAALARKARDIFHAKLVQLPGTKEFLNNWAAERTVLTNLEPILRPFKGSPKDKTAVLREMNRAFEDSSVGYISALKDLENMTGMKIIDFIASRRVTQNLPPSTQSFFGDLARLAVSPVSSPKLAGMYSRAAGRFQNPATEKLRNVLIDFLAQAAGMGQK